jgi:hypothetical protein
MVGGDLPAAADVADEGLAVAFETAYRIPAAPMDPALVDLVERVGRDQAARVVDPVRQAADVRPMRNRKTRESSLPSISRWNRFAKASTKKRFKISQRL